MEDGTFDIGLDLEKNKVTVQFPCCEHSGEEIGIETVYLTPEKAVFMAQLLLEKTLNIFWMKKDG